MLLGRKSPTAQTQETAIIKYQQDLEIQAIHPFSQE